jgi:putative addiction module component (TIGR02574 family)
MGIQVSEILELSVAERIRIVEDIWDSIAKDQESLLLGNKERIELEKRLQKYRKNPTEGIECNSLKKKLISKK